MLLLAFSSGACVAHPRNDQALVAQDDNRSQKTSPVTVNFGWTVASDGDVFIVGAREPAGRSHFVYGFRLGDQIQHLWTDYESGDLGHLAAKHGLVASLSPNGNFTIRNATSGQVNAVLSIDDGRPYLPFAFTGDCAFLSKNSEGSLVAYSICQSRAWGAVREYEMDGFHVTASDGDNLIGIGENEVRIWKKRGNEVVPDSKVPLTEARADNAIIWGNTLALRMIRGELVWIEVFRRVRGEWTKVEIPQNTALADVGYALSATHDSLVVGAPSTRRDHDPVGAVAVYRTTEPKWSILDLNANTDSESLLLGWAVAIVDRPPYRQVVAGAPGLWVDASTTRRDKGHVCVTSLRAKERWTCFGAPRP